MSKRYKVVGSAPILDHKPGETFEADLDETNESFLVGIGGLAVVDEAVDAKVETFAKGGVIPRDGVGVATPEDDDLAETTKRLNIESHKR